MHPLGATDQNTMQQKPQKADRWTSKTGKAKTFSKSSIDCLMVHSAGKYYASVKVAGKVVRRCLNTNDFNVAKLQLPVVLAEIRGAKNASTSGTLGAAIHTEAHRADPTKKESTRGYYQSIALAIGLVAANRRVNPLGISMSRVTLAELKALMDDFGGFYAASRYNGALTLLRSTYATAIEAGHVGSDLTAKFKRLPHKGRKMDLPSSETFARIVADIAGTRRKYSKASAMVVEFLAYTGLRISEGRSLRWRDIKEDKLVVRTAKNDGMRQLPFVRAALELIERMRASVLPTGDDDPVFPIQTPRFALMNSCKRLGLDHMRVHDLRHLFATRCIESGVDLPTVAGWLGHKDGGVLVAQVYGHLRKEHSSGQAALVDM